MGRIDFKSSSSALRKSAIVGWVPTGSAGVDRLGLKFEVHSAGTTTTALSLGELGDATFAGNITPTNDNSKTLGSSQKRWSDVFATQTTVGGIFETGLRTENIGDNLTGTIVSWYKGKLIPCYKEEDTTVMGVIKHGKDEPIILGAEHVLVTGNVKEGDFIVTSKKMGHGKAVKSKWLGLINRSLTGKIIGQALEDASGESNLIKVYIYKH
jgi:hypothetical protein